LQDLPADPTPTSDVKAAGKKTDVDSTPTPRSDTPTKKADPPVAYVSEEPTKEVPATPTPTPTLGANILSSKASAYPNPAYEAENSAKKANLEIKPAAAVQKMPAPAKSVATVSPPPLLEPSPEQPCIALPKFITFLCE